MKRDTTIKRVHIGSWYPAYLGIIAAILAIMASLLPSLLPRPWYIQGFITGLSAAIGYGLGTLTSAVARWFLDNESKHTIKAQAWKWLKIVAPIMLVIFLILGRQWQNEVHRLVGVETIGFGQSVLIVATSVPFFCMFLGIGRLIRKIFRKLTGYLKRRVPLRVGVALAIFLTTFITYGLLSGVMVRTFYKAADSAFGARDNTAPAGIIQPESLYRSGSPASLIPWEKVGFQGRGFVGSGPTKQALSAFSGVEAKPPIRIYAGLASAGSAEERANLAVKELKRTDAFSRKVLVIATTTGTGWIDPTVVDALEFMYNGDSAIVSQQYSYLPSWISFLVDQDRAREAGRVLYDAVIEEWAALPENERPKLLVYGLSLGSFGGQTAFSGVNDIRRSVDGALFTGTPNDTELWRTITAQRDTNSPEWQPTYRDGVSVRFASTKEDILSSPELWTDDTKVLFVQHANDPVVWFSFDLLFNKPDWLNEPRGRAVSPDTRWFPIITFLHIGLDQAIAASAPIGEGHYYVDTTVYAWQAIAAPDHWTTKDSQKLQKIINSADYPTYSSGSN